MKSNFQIALLSLLSISLALPAMAQQTGEATFKAKCAMCHGTDGTGNTQIGKNMKIRSLKSADDIKETDAEMCIRDSQLPAHAADPHLLSHGNFPPAKLQH